MTPRQWRLIWIGAVCYLVGKVVTTWILLSWRH